MAKKLVAQDVLDYEKAVQDLKAAKKTEITLRNKIIGAFKYDATEGVQHKTIEGLDIDIAITLGLTRKIDVDALDTLWADLSAEQKTAILRKPSLDVKVFKGLVEEGDAGYLTKIVVETPSQATVKLKFEE